MGIEIDFLAVGDASKSGDAIAVRFGNLHGQRNEQTVMTIDGGNVDSGERLVAHVKKHFNTDIVDFAFMTHPDGDHASGMRAVLEQLQVSTLLMHRPWLHSNHVHQVVDDGRTSPNSIKNRAQENLAAAYEVEQLALSKNPPIKIIEPFQGTSGKVQGGDLLVLGPDQAFYRDLLSTFDFMPPKKASLAGVLGQAYRSLVESWNSETLIDPSDDETSSENQSSMILLVTVEDKHYLFTGDAGVVSLGKALDYAALKAVDWSKLQFLQVPHHGSKHNLGPTILNRLLGRPVAQPTTPVFSAFVSAAKLGAPKHPNKRVLNALTRRRTKVFSTSGSGLCQPGNGPDRGWTKVTPLPFYDTLDDDEA